MDGLKSKKTLIFSGILLGIAAVILAYLGNPKNMAICIACFIRDTAGAMKLHNAAAVQYARPEVTGIVLGAFVVSLITKEYRSTSGSSPMLRFVLGMIMMCGALVFLGCPLRMLLRMSAGDLNAYVGLLGFVTGIATGTLALKRGFTLGRSHEAKPSSGYILPVLLAAITILSVFTSLLAASESGPGSMHAPLFPALAAGLIFGAVCQRSRTCFAGSFRNAILVKDFDLLSVIGALFAVMLAYNLVTGGFKLSFNGQPIAHAQHLWNFLGLYIVGFAAVLAGGCPLRQLILAGQGSSDSAVTFLGLFTGAAICHNLGLVSQAAAPATETSAFHPGGPGTAGKIAVVLCIAALFAIGFLPSGKKGAEMEKGCC